MESIARIQQNLIPISQGPVERESSYCLFLSFFIGSFFLTSCGIHSYAPFSSKSTAVIPSIPEPEPAETWTITDIVPDGLNLRRATGNSTLSEFKLESTDPRVVLSWNESITDGGGGTTVKQYARLFPWSSSGVSDFIALETDPTNPLEGLYYNLASHRRYGASFTQRNSIQYASFLEHDPLNAPNYQFVFVNFDHNLEQNIPYAIPALPFSPVAMYDTTLLPLASGIGMLLRGFPATHDITATQFSAPEVSFQAPTDIVNGSFFAPELGHTTLTHAKPKTSDNIIYYPRIESDPGTVRIARIYTHAADAAANISPSLPLIAGASHKVSSSNQAIDCAPASEIGQMFCAVIESNNGENEFQIEIYSTLIGALVSIPANNTWAPQLGNSFTDGWLTSPSATKIDRVELHWNLPYLTLVYQSGQTISIGIAKANSAGEISKQGERSSINSTYSNDTFSTQLGQFTSVTNGASAFISFITENASNEEHLRLIKVDYRSASSSL